MAAGITASASGSRGKADGEDITQRNSHLSAGKTATIISGNDTTLKGAVLSADTVLADIGGDLTIESLQDTSTYASKDKAVGGSVTFGLGFSASASYSSNKVNGDFASVTEQSGIQAGDGGFNIRVGGNTDLKGGVIASTQAAVDAGVNRLQTGTLTVSDITNTSRYEASTQAAVDAGVNRLQTGTLTVSDITNTSRYEAKGISLSGGYSTDGKKGNDKETNPGSQTPSTVDKGSTWAVQNFGDDTSLGAPGFASEKGSETSVTRSGISGGVLTITDTNSQLALTAAGVESVLAGLNRDVLTGNSAAALTKNWDPVALAEKVRNEAQITATFTEQARGAVNSYVGSKKDALSKREQQANTPEEVAAIATELDEIETQEKMLNILIGAVTGSTTGAISKEGLSSAADWMRERMKESSSTFAGVIDPGAAAVDPTSKDPNVLNNENGPSVGVDNDKYKLGGTRSDLDALCGPDNGRYKKFRTVHWQSSTVMSNGIAKKRVNLFQNS
ncbi:hemagglutinin repeat-containing protein [Xanthomonas dyei]|uniref:hemagglutinin repeat-containing protein n=1 Tax=Xanthomonas dyei TaxID=743699 RepID=UPI003D170AE8